MITLVKLLTGGFVCAMSNILSVVFGGITCEEYKCPFNAVILINNRSFSQSEILNPGHYHPKKFTVSV